MAMLNLIANKTTPLLLLCALATPVFANYCDTRATQRDYDNCYRVNIDTQNKLLEKYYRAVIDHPNLSAADRANLEQNQSTWTNSVNSQCRDYPCMLSALEARNSQLQQLFRKLEGPAPATPAQKKTVKAKTLSLDELKVAIRKDRMYDVGFGQVPNASKTALIYAGAITYKNVQYVIPSERFLEIIPTYIHQGKLASDGSPDIPDGYCNDIFCKRKNGEMLGVLPSFWKQLKNQNYITSDTPIEVTNTQANSSSGEACYEKKLADFRKENGEEVPVIHDQINEWEKQCGVPLSE